MPPQPPPAKTQPPTAQPPKTRRARTQPAKAGTRARPGTAPAGPAAGASARERLLAAANELFYAEGVHTVGIDRVIEKAGVAKASLYNTFGSKDELVRAYLESRHARTSARIAGYLERYATPGEKLLGVFEAQGELFTEPGFHGCAFVSATSEAHGEQVGQAADDYRAWVRSLLTGLAREAGAADPETLGRQLHMIYDGASLSARMDRPAAPPAGSSPAAAARAAARALLDAALG
ncbi:MAG TPA: TetR/AcrR family transcriptional regulator [Trebonia sp.]|nr:TetR/AcrR family transcriptional regulator [Trebonia sp.]